MDLTRRLWGRTLVLLAMVIPFAGAEALHAQRVRTQPDDVIELRRGQGAVISLDSDVERISLADPDIADVDTPAPREILVRGVSPGTTTLMIWTQGGTARLYQVEVSADIASLERQLQQLFPELDLSLASTGNVLIVSGQARDPFAVRRAVAIAEAAGFQVINNVQAPSAEQILLQVRFAEVNQSMLRDIGFNLFAQNPDNLLDGSVDYSVTSLAEGVVDIILSGDNGRFEALIDALKSTGNFRSLAEPNLIALEGQEASFLAGGEFPFPTVQGGGQSNAVTIDWREFGVNLSFTPTITNTGSIRMRVRPEVSSLDFANGLVLQGFEVPTILTRRAESEVELRPGQHLALAGLLDNSLSENVEKIPLLGDLPIIGTFFRSNSQRQERTELLVIVTPHIIYPQDTPPALPTGELDTWGWDRSMVPVPLSPVAPDTTNLSNR